MPLRRRLLFSAVTLAAVLVAAVPAVLAMLLHGERLRFTGDVGRGSAIYIVMTFVYLLWLPGTVVLLVWVFDHLGYQYSLTERKQRPTRKERRRLRAGLSFLASNPNLGQSEGAAGGEGGGPAGGAGGGSAGGEGGEDAAAQRPRPIGRPPGSRPVGDRAVGDGAASGGHTAGGTPAGHATGGTPGGRRSSSSHDTGGV